MLRTARATNRLKPRSPQIVVLGNGGFSVQPDNGLLDDCVLGLVRNTRPRICFVPTAGGESDNYVARFYAAFRPPRADPTHLPLFARGGCGGTCGRGGRWQRTAGWRSWRRGWVAGCGRVRWVGRGSAGLRKERGNR
jgi:hypothetical protein